MGSWQARSGASLPMIGRTLGHKSIQATAIYAQIDQENKMEWVFAGPDTKLYQKKYFRKGKLLWNVRYFSYQTQDSLSYPSEIYYENNEKKYTLSLRLKEVLG